MSRRQDCAVEHDILFHKVV